MGKILLLFMIALEVVFLILRLKSKTNMKKERSIVALIILALFVILTFAGVIEWSFRYYLYAQVIGIQGLIGALLLLRKIKSKAIDKKSKIIIKAVGSCLLYLLVLIPALVFPQTRQIPVTGKYTVETALETYVDENRVETYDDLGKNREVNVEFWYPKEAKDNCPLVVFSHGMNGVKMSNASLFQELASNGYVVCSIDHPYQSFYTKNADGKTTIISQKYLEQYQEAISSSDKEKLYHYIQEWMQLREGDIDFTIDTILNKTKQKHKTFYQKINTEKIAVCGHSMGGAAALGIGRKRSDVCAVLSLEAPYMSDIMGVDIAKNEFIWNDEPYPIPVMHVYSDSTWGHFSDTQMPLYAKNEKALNAVDEIVYNVHVKSAGHLELTDLSLISPLITNLLDSSSKQKDTHEILEKINRESLQFLNYYLMEKGEEPKSKEI